MTRRFPPLRFEGIVSVIVVIGTDKVDQRRTVSDCVTMQFTWRYLFYCKGVFLEW